MNPRIVAAEVKDENTYEEVKEPKMTNSHNVFSAVQELFKLK